MKQETTVIPNENPEVTKNYRLSFGDYFKFKIFFTRTFRTLLTYVFIIILFVVFLSIKDKTSDEILSPESILSIILWSVLGSAFMVAYFFLTTFLGTKRAYSINKIGEIDINFTIFSDGIKQLNPDGEYNIVHWNELYKVGDGYGIFAFLASRSQGLIVSKKIFTEEELALVSKYIKSALQKF